MERFFQPFARAKDGTIEHIIPDTEQSAPADTGAVAIKLGTPFALVENQVVRIGKTPEEEPVMTAGAPSDGVLIPADFASVAFAGTVQYVSESEVQIKTNKGTAVFEAGVSKMVLNGKDAMLDVPTRSVNSELMISLRGLVEGVLGEKLSSRKDVYRNDIYYANGRAVDLSAQTIAYIDQKLSGKN